MSIGTNDESKNPKNPTRRIVAIRADSVQEEKTEWFLDQRIPAEEFSLIIGREGLGKSTLTLDLLAQATLGTLDGCHFGTPVNVAIIANEDSLEKTLKPRVSVAGANLERVFFIGSETVMTGYNGTLILPNDIEQLRQTVEQHQIKAIVLDPLVGILNERIDTHNYASTKQGLQHLNEFARNCNVTVLAVTHENKGNSQDFSRRVNGSVAFTTVPRAVLGVIRDPQDTTTETLLFGNSKVSNGRLNLPAKCFRIIGTQTPTGIESSKIEWLPDAKSSFVDLSSDNRTIDERSEENETVSFLRDLMETNNGEIAAKEATELLAQNGLPNKGGSLDRTKRKLGIQTVRIADAWIWRLPDRQADSKDSWIHSTGTRDSRIQQTDSMDSYTMDKELRQRLDAPKPPCSVCGESLGLADLELNATVHGLCE
jgi:hypothetical protein